MGSPEDLSFAGTGNNKPEKRKPEEEEEQSSEEESDKPPKKEEHKEAHQMFLSKEMAVFGLQRNLL